MKIIKDSNKLMRQKSKEVTLPLSEEDMKIAQDMMDWIDESQVEGSLKRAGVGIAAVQTGHLKRMFYIREGDYVEFLVNPEIVGEGITAAALEHGEGCLSVDEDGRKNIEGLVHRKFKIIIKGFSLIENKYVEYTKTGYHAIVIQHEMDHLDGKLFYDRINHKDKWTPKPQEELI